LATLRGVFGYSQTEFAEELSRVVRETRKNDRNNRNDRDKKLTDRTVRYWERGKSAPRPENKAAIVAVLGGRDHPHWDRDEFNELACCLGIRVRPPDPPSVTPPNPPPEDEDRRGTTIMAGTGGTTKGPTGTGQGKVPHLPRDGRWRNGLLPVIGVVVVVVLILWRTLPPEPGPANVTVACGKPWVLHRNDGSTRILDVTSRHGALHSRFHRGVPNTIFEDLDADGDAEILIVSIDTSHCDKPSGQIRIECFSADGSHRWTHFMDDTPTYRDGSRHSESAWSLERIQTLDWTGDGHMEVAVLGTHMMYSSMLIILDADGNRVCEYVNTGHMRDFAVLPHAFYESIQQQAEFSVPAARGSGAALAISAQTNEAPTGCQLVILPPGFETGAYPARTPHYQHASLRPAHDAVFIRLRPSLVALNYPAGHNWPANVDFDPTHQRIKIGTIEEPEGEAILRFFDARLRQVSVIPTDRFRNKYRAMQEELHLASIDSEAMSGSVEIIDHRVGDEWITTRNPGSWVP
jgi:hypothetical protein